MLTITCDFLKKKTVQTQNETSFAEICKLKDDVI
jgi:hypothetical protein